MMKKILTVVLLVSVSDVVKADDTESSDNRKIIYKSKTEIDFEGLEVQGELVKPSSSLVLERKSSDFNPLINLRTDFNDKIDESVSEMK